MAQTPQGGERVDCGTVIGVTMSAEAPEWMTLDSLLPTVDDLRNFFGAENKLLPARTLNTGWFPGLCVRYFWSGNIYPHG